MIPHVIITALEHDSVALTARAMAGKGLIGERGKQERMGKGRRREEEGMS